MSRDRDEGAGGCKGDYAATVRMIAPTPELLPSMNVEYVKIVIGLFRYWSLDARGCMGIIRLTKPGDPKVTRRKPDPKTEALRDEGCLHPHPEKVTDELFVAREFFDARDLVQVKYEMLRRVCVDGRPVSESATRFGLSRPSYYQAQGAFEQGGLPALLRKKPGPRRAHKLSPDVVAALREARREQSQLSSEDLVRLVEERFGISVHRRSIERALARQEKKRQ